MPSYRLTFDRSGHPALEEEFCGDSPRDADGQGWTLSPGAADPSTGPADRKPAAVPFQFGGELSS
jgi:hypothetical protein